MSSDYDKICCRYCGKIPQFTHRHGVSICKCNTVGCKGNLRWETFEDWKEFFAVGEIDKSTED